MKKYIVAAKEKQRFISNNPDRLYPHWDAPSGEWNGRWEYTGEWDLCSTAYAEIATYQTVRKAITTNWGTSKDPKRVKVFIINAEELEPVDDDQARLEWADRMIQYCGKLMVELEAKLKG